MEFFVPKQRQQQQKSMSPRRWRLLVCRQDTQFGYSKSLFAWDIHVLGMFSSAIYFLQQRHTEWDHLLSACIFFHAAITPLETIRLCVSSHESRTLNGWMNGWNRTFCVLKSTPKYVSFEVIITIFFVYFFSFSIHKISQITTWGVTWICTAKGNFNWKLYPVVSTKQWVSIGEIN